MTQNFKIVQINIRSAYSNKSFLKKFMIDNKIDVAVLCETWTKDTNKLQLQNYKTYIKTRPDGYGGVGFIIRNEISTNIINQSLNFNRLEIMEIEINIKNIRLRIISFYNNSNRNSNEINDEFEKLLDHYKNKNKTIIMGDINAHHILWEENSQNDTLGNKIADTITTSPFCIKNDGTHTRRDARNNKTYAVDISLISNEISSDFDWKCIHENLGSDHFPIILEYNKELDLRKKMKKIDWPKIEKEMNEFNPYHTLNLEDLEEYMEEIILKNTKKNCKRSQNDT